MERKIASTRCQVRVIGCRPPRPGPRPGSVTSSASPASRLPSWASASAARRWSSRPSTFCLSALIAAPRSLRSSGASAPRPFRAAVSSPALPRYFALAFSSAAASAAAAKSAAARSTMLCWSDIPAALGMALVGDAGLDLVRDARERGLVEHREVGEHLAVDLDLRLLQARHERAVGEAELAHRGIDARDPERPERALAVAAVAVGVLPRLHHRFLGDAVDVAPAAAEALGLGEDLLVARARRYSTLDSWHGASLTGIRQHRPHAGL